MCPRAATTTYRDFFVRANSRIKGSTGLGIIVDMDNMANVYVRVH